MKIRTQVWKFLLPILRPFYVIGSLDHCRHLPFLHPFPADESIQIIDQEHHKANDHRQIADVLHCRQSPQDDQHHIVGGVGQGEVRAAAEGQIYRNEAGGHRKRAGNHIGGVEVVQNEIEANCHQRGQHIHEYKFLIFQPIDSHLRMVSVIGIPQPGNKSEERHRAGHAEISDHLPKVGKGVGDYTIEQAEHDHQRLSDGIAFRIENQ